MVAPVNHPGGTLAITLWLLDAHIQQRSGCSFELAEVVGPLPTNPRAAAAEQAMDLACRAAIHELINKAVTAGYPNVDGPELGWRDARQQHLGLRRRPRVAAQD